MGQPVPGSEIVVKSRSVKRNAKNARGLGRDRATLSPKKINIVVITVLSNYIVTAGHCTHCNTSQNCVSKCTKLHLSTYSFQKFWGGGMFLDHPRKLMAFCHSELLPQTINPRQNPEGGGEGGRVPKKVLYRQSPPPPPRCNPFPLYIPFLTEKVALSFTKVLCLLTNGTPFTYLVQNVESLFTAFDFLTAINSFISPFRSFYRPK